MNKITNEQREAIVREAVAKRDAIRAGAVSAPAARPRMTPDERHEDVVRRYPGGLTPAQFCHEALASADEDGKLDPPALADWFGAQSLLIGMWMEGLIERRCRRDEAGPWFITDKGKAAAPGVQDTEGGQTNG